MLIRGRRAERLLLAPLLAVAAGCFTEAEGRQPDPTRLYFPTGLVVSPGRTALYVANSDFDLQYGGGWVQILDLASLRAQVAPIAAALAEGVGTFDACARAGRGANPEPWLNPGPCSAFEVAPLVRAHALVGAFASGLLLVHEQGGAGARLFVPVRGDPSVTYFDVQDDRGAGAGFVPELKLDCSAGQDGFCDGAHRLGQDRERTLRGLQLPADPLGIAASADGVAVVAAHQTQAAASLVYNDWRGVPSLAYFAANLPNGPTELVAIPEPGMLGPARAEAEAAGRYFQYQPSFALTFRATAEVDILQYYADSGASPARPFIVRASGTPIYTNATGYDSRGIAIVARRRQACEATCHDLGCLRECSEVPLQLFLANRTPASLVVGQIDTRVSSERPDPAGAEILTGAYETLFAYDSVPLDFGPSRVEVGTVIDRDGQPQEHVFVVCFDSRTIFSYDPEEARIDAVIKTGRGPHDIALDAGLDAQGSAYAYLYVGHFTDSYIGVVDLDMRRPSFGQMFASVGVPTPPKESR
ncbi:MAG: hypothetical protein HY744_10750 [Deltaproteobacteria bacterium]|nr:hypothetical protein [Deltaproteobacteria bacterium]